MTRLYLTVNIGEYQSVLPQITRELEAGDERTLEEYLDQIVWELPRTESEYRSLCSIYAAKQHPVEDCYFVTENDEVSNNTRINEIVKKNIDVKVFAVNGPRFKQTPAGYPSDVLLEYYNVVAGIRMQEITAYGRWQASRMRRSSAGGR